MSDFVNNVEGSLSSLSRLLGEDNIEDIKRRIADIIVKAVEDDIYAYKERSYVFYPPDYIQGVAEDAFDEVEKKIKKMYKDAMLEVAERSVKKYKELTIKSLIEETD